MAEENEATLTLDNKQYPIASLSDKARAQLQNLRIAELELQRLQVQQGLIQTARAVYLNSLKAELPKDD